VCIVLQDIVPTDRLQPQRVSVDLITNIFFVNGKGEDVALLLKRIRSINFSEALCKEGRASKFMLRARASRRVGMLLLSPLLPMVSTAAESLPRSMPVLEQSDVRGTFYASIFAGLRSEVNATTKSPVTLYVELAESIAHELNQRLGAILCSAEAADLLLESPTPNLSEIKDVQADIRRD
jgi:hypothetical protein